MIKQTNYRHLNISSGNTEKVILDISENTVLDLVMISSAARLKFEIKEHYNTVFAGFTTPGQTLQLPNLGYLVSNGYLEICLQNKDMLSADVYVSVSTYDSRLEYDRQFTAALESELSK